MKANFLIRKSISLALAVAVFATYSMVTLAGTGKFAGEIRVIGNGKSAVTVNGEAVDASRSIFSTSSIVTPADSSAIVDLGKAGTIEVAPATKVSVTFDKDSAMINVAEGNIRVLATETGVKLMNADGASRVLNTGDTSAASRQDDDDDDDAGAAWWLWALVFGGAAVGMIYAATRDTDVRLGGGGTVVSPVR